MYLCVVFLFFYIIIMTNPSISHQTREAFVTKKENAEGKKLQ
jgi:uncharacterized membrane protein